MANFFQNETPAIEKLTRNITNATTHSCGPDDSCNPTAGLCGPTGLCFPGTCDPCPPAAPYNNNPDFDNSQTPTL